MSKLWALILFFYALPDASAQGFRLKLLSSEGGEPVAFAHIILKPSQSGFISDINGVVLIPTGSLTNNDSILLSAIAFDKKVLALNQLFPAGDSLASVKMSPAVYHLDAVNLKPPERVFEKKLGNWGSGVSGVKLSPLPGMEFAVKVGLKETQVARLDEVKFQVLKSEEDTLWLRMNIYNLNSHGSPGSLIIRESVIFEVWEKSSEVVRDISAYNLAVNHDFIVSIQFLPGGKAEMSGSSGSEKRAPVRKATFNKDKKVEYGTRAVAFDDSGYFRTSFTGEWYQVKIMGSKLSPCIGVRAQLSEY